MAYVWAFVVGGAICVVGQLLLDLTSLTPARILTGYVVAGVALSALGLYGLLVDFAGSGASVPLLGVRPPAGPGGAAGGGPAGAAGLPDRRAAGGSRRHHRQPAVRSGVLLCGQKPRPELTAPFRPSLRPGHGMLGQKGAFYMTKRAVCLGAAGMLGALPGPVLGLSGAGRRMGRARGLPLGREPLRRPGRPVWRWRWAGSGCPNLPLVPTACWSRSRVP